MIKKWMFTIICLLGIKQLACDDPCVQLSHRICKCERTEIEKQTCLQRVDNVFATIETNQGQQDCCVTLLENCDCDKLSKGELSTCGLAQESEDGTVNSCLVAESKDD